MVLRIMKIISMFTFIPFYFIIFQEGGTFVNEGCTRNCSCSNNRLICENEYRCGANAVCSAPDGVRQCTCNEGYEGDGKTCEALYTDCKDVYDAGHRLDGVYTILPARWTGSPFTVYCKMDNGGGWTVSRY